MGNRQRALALPGRLRMQQQQDKGTGGRGSAACLSQK